MVYRRPCFQHKKYGSNNYLKFKDDVHPGHCSVHTKKGQYLSIGTNEGLENLSITSKHEIIYGESFEADMIGMKRFPEKRLDFYTLNIDKINESIDLSNGAGQRSKDQIKDADINDDLERESMVKKKTVK